MKKMTKSRIADVAVAGTGKLRRRKNSLLVTLPGRRGSARLRQRQELLTTQTAARVLGVSSKTVQNWADEGHLPALRTPGGHRRIPAKAVRRALRERRLSRGFVVMVVEDDRDMARWYELGLSDMTAVGPAGAAHTVELQLAESGWHALRRILNARPDMLITDLRMEPLSGFDLLGALSLRPELLSGMSVLVVTGLSREELTRSPRLPDGVALLRKPVSLEQVREQVEQVWQRWQVALA